ncbi:MAG TPA: hypothetical protein DDY27_15980 [Hyphomonadaceae bacterium]|nr:hypothetical protein [Hyphomonadaceae bacterium]
MTKLTVSKRLTGLEATVEAGLSAGKQAWEALREINNAALYKERGYSTFTKYLSDEWQVDISTARRNIAAAATQERLALAVGNDPDLEKIQTERQLRPLVTVPNSDIKQVFDKAATMASDEGSKKITARHIEKAKTEVVGKPASAKSAPNGPAASTSDPVVAGAKARAIDYLTKLEFQLGNLGLDQKLSSEISKIRKAVEAIK